MKLRKMIKKKAHAAISGNRGSAVALIFIYLIVSVIINMADAAALRMLGYEFTLHAPNVFTYSNDFFYNAAAIGITVVAWIVRMALVVPLGYGMLNWYLELTDRRKQGVMHIFWPYESRAALRGILLSLNISVKTVVVAWLLLILPITLIVMSTVPTLGYSLSMVLGVSGAVLTVLAVVLLWAFIQRFAIARILLCEKYQLTVHQAVKASVRYTKGHRFELLRFELSFLPWILPLLASGGMMTFSLVYDHYSAMPFVWTLIFIAVAVATYLMLTPYYTMASVMYARYLYEYGVWQQEGSQTVSQQVVGSTVESVAAEPAAPEQTIEQYSVQAEDNKVETPSSDGQPPM